MKQAKRSAQSIDSGEAQRCHDLPADIPDYSIDETVEAAIQDSSENKRTSETQTDQKKTKNNSTQTDVDQCELLKQILDKVTNLEMQVKDLKEQLAKPSAHDKTALVSSALHSLNDPYDLRHLSFHSYQQL